MRVRVQKHGKVFAHRQKTRCQHFWRAAAHHHPVAIVFLAGLPQQGVAHRAAD